MTTLAFDFRGTCTLCGCRLRGILVGSFRVNKKSLRATNSTLSGIDRLCPECRFETASAPSVWALQPDAQAKVDAVRGSA